LPEQLRPGDLLVVNDTRVIPARLFGRTAAGAVELLLIRPVDVAPEQNGSTGEVSWLCLGQPARRLRLDAELRFPGDVMATVSEVRGEGRYRVTFHDGADVVALMTRHGEIPLPPYIRRPDGPLPEDQLRYQTIFARVPGAVAAPTAGLHFTPRLLAALTAGGIDVVPLTLLVGPATFLPLREGERHSAVPAERYEIPVATAAAVSRARACGRRVVAVGTTTVRALESACAADGTIHPGRGSTDLVIAPGHRFRAIDALLTNLHLPRTSLLGLVAAFAGVDPTLAAYRAASAGGYRFYSYGDAMLIR